MDKSADEQYYRQITRRKTEKVALFHKSIEPLIKEKVNLIERHSKPQITIKFMNIKRGGRSLIFFDEISRDLPKEIKKLLLEIDKRIEITKDSIFKDSGFAHE